MTERKVLTSESVRGDITADKVKKEIDEGWTNPFIIAKNILGHEIWECLPEWDQQIIVAHIHKIAVENPEMRKKYFS